MELFPAAVFNPSPASRARAARQAGGGQTNEHVPFTVRRVDIDIDADMFNAVRLRHSMLDVVFASRQPDSDKVPPAPPPSVSAPARTVLQARPDRREMAVA